MARFPTFMPRFKEGDFAWPMVSRRSYSSVYVAFLKPKGFDDFIEDLWLSRSLKLFSIILSFKRRRVKPRKAAALPVI